MHNGRINEIEDERIKKLLSAARREMKKCRMCPRECGVDRLAGERGFCGAAPEGEIFYAGLLVNEEAFLNPAYEVFFTGCNLGCRFCYLADKVKRQGAPLAGHPLYSDPGLASARSLCAVGGEPAVNLKAALELFGSVPVRPRVWNSNMIYSGLVAEAVAEIADVVAADLHFGRDECAERIAGFPGYLATVLGNLERALAAGLRVVVRHLILPGHEDCCGQAVVRLLAEKVPGASFNLLGNYLAPALSNGAPELGGKVREGAADELREEAVRLGLTMEPPALLRRPALHPSRERSEIVIGPGGEISVLHLTPGLAQMVEVMKEEWDEQAGAA